MQLWMFQNQYNEDVSKGSSEYALIGLFHIYQTASRKDAGNGAKSRLVLGPRAQMIKFKYL